MGFFSFRSEKSETVDPELQKKLEQEQTVKDWIPVKDIRDGIVLLKSGDYVKILEVIPINFKLKSKFERRALLYNYRAFLKGCRFPIQISIQCRKANIDPHIDRMKKFYASEKNPQVRNMLRGYVKLVTDIGTQGTITRRYFLVIPFVKHPSMQEFSFNDVIKQLKDKSALCKEFLLACNNEVIDHGDTEFAVNVLYSYLNKQTCEVQKLGKKLTSLMGTFLDIAEEPDDEEEEEF